MNVFLTDIVRVRVGWTTLSGDPETGNVYAHSTGGLLCCFDKDLKKIIWSHSLTEEYGRVSGYGGRLTSPIVDGDLVILSMLNGSWGEMAIGGNRFVAFDKRTGDVVWWNGTGIRVSDTYSSTPVIAVINGERLVISGGFAGVYAFRVRDGVKVWGYEICHEAVNLTPVVVGNLVYIGHGEENDNNTQGSVLCLDASDVKDGKPKLVWQRGRHQGQVRLAGRPRRQGLRPRRRGRPLLPRREHRQPEVGLPVRHRHQGFAGPGRRQNLHRRRGLQLPDPQAGRKRAARRSADCTSGRKTTFRCPSSAARRCCTAASTS